MPVYEHMCVADGCKKRNVIEEHFFSSSNAENPSCDECGAKQARLVSAFKPVWTKPISEYGDSSKETYQKDVQSGGHWVLRKRSSRRPDGQPEREFITSVAQQRAYCREEGLMPPDEVGCFEVHSNGQTYSSSGMRGQWV